MWQWQYRWVFNPFFGVYQLQLVQVFVPVAVVPVAYGYPAPYGYANPGYRL